MVRSKIQVYVDAGLTGSRVAAPAGACPGGILMNLRNSEGLAIENYRCDRPHLRTLRGCAHERTEGGLRVRNRGNSARCRFIFFCFLLLWRYHN